MQEPSDPRVPAELVQACRALPPAQGNYLEKDFIRSLMLTVLDFQMQSVVVARAIKHFDAQWTERRPTLDDLKAILALYPDNQCSNTALAQHLWGYNHWSRAGLLRRLVDYFESVGVIDEATLKRWAETSDFSRDFEGRIPGLGPVAYYSLLMRQGVQTVVPDSHTHRFVESILGRKVSDEELIKMLEVVAEKLEIPAYELSWRIWERQRGGPGAS